MSPSLRVSIRDLVASLSTRVTVISILSKYMVDMLNLLLPMLKCYYEGLLIICNYIFFNQQTHNPKENIL